MSVSLASSEKPWKTFISLAHGFSWWIPEASLRPRKDRNAKLRNANVENMHPCANCVFSSILAMKKKNVHLYLLIITMIIKPSFLLHHSAAEWPMHQAPRLSSVSNKIHGLPCTLSLLYLRCVVGRLRETRRRILFHLENVKRWSHLHIWSPTIKANLRSSLLKVFLTKCVFGSFKCLLNCGGAFFWFMIPSGKLT